MPKHKIPEFLTCPITGKPISDPVIASDGITYEREALKNLFGIFIQTVISPADIKYNRFPQRKLKKGEYRENFLARDIIAQVQQGVSWQNILENNLNCPISLEQLESPRITPTGHTYSQDMIELALNSEPREREPQTRSPCKVDDLWENHFAQFCIDYCRQVIAEEQEHPEIDSNPLSFTALVNKISKKFLSKWNTDVYTEEDGYDALKHAIASDNITAIKQLVKSGIAIGVEELHFAVETTDNVEMLKTLFRYARTGYFEGVPVNSEIDGISLLHRAVLANHQMVAHALIQQGARLDTVTNCEEQRLHNRTPLTLAIEINNPGMLATLVSYGSPKDFTCTYLGKKYTPLQYAAMRGYAACAQVLLDAKDKWNAQDADGNTPLHLAIKFGHTDVVALLLKYKDENCSINMVNKRGERPIDIAVGKSNLNIVAQLLAHDADVTVGYINDRQTINPLAIAERTAKRIASTAGNDSPLAKAHQNMLKALSEKQQEQTIAFRKYPGYVPPEPFDRNSQSLISTKLEDFDYRRDSSDELHQRRNKTDSSIDIRTMLHHLTPEQEERLDEHDRRLNRVEAQAYDLLQRAIALNQQLGGNYSEEPYQTRESRDSMEPRMTHQTPNSELLDVLKMTCARIEAAPSYVTDQQVEEFADLVQAVKQQSNRADSQSINQAEAMLERRRFAQALKKRIKSYLRWRNIRYSVKDLIIDGTDKDNRTGLVGNLSSMANLYADMGSPSFFNRLNTIADNLESRSLGVGLQQILQDEVSRHSKAIETQPVFRDGPR